MIFTWYFELSMIFQDLGKMVSHAMDKFDYHNYCNMRDLVNSTCHVTLPAMVRISEKDPIWK